MSRIGARNVPTKLIVDDFGEMLLYRCCTHCRSWKPQAIGHFTPRERDSQTRRVVKWHSWCLVCHRPKSREYHRKNTDRLRAYRRRSYQRAKEDPQRLEALRRRHREQMRKRRQDPAQKERMRKAAKAYYERIRNDPERWAAYLERQRINHRLRQEKAGRALAEIRSLPATMSSEPQRPNLPAKPLGDAIFKRLVALGIGYADGSSVERFLPTIGVEPKSYRDWRKGRRRWVQFNTVQAALSGLDLAWWDVYPPEKFPKAVEAFEGVAA